MSRAAAAGMRSRVSASSTRSRSGLPLSPWCSRTTSPTCVPMVSAGLSVVSGSCSTMAMALPRTRRIWDGVLSSRFSPSSSTRPPTMRPAGSGTSRTRDRHVTDLPEPDSPTSARVSPAPTAKLTPSTALMTPRRVKKDVRRSSTTRSGAGFAMIGPIGTSLELAAHPALPGSHPARWSSLGAQLDVLVRGGEAVAGEESQARLLHARADTMEEAEIPDGREHRPFVHELLHPVQDRLALGPVQLRRLLPEQAIDVGVPAVGVGAARDRIGLQPGRGVPRVAGEEVGHVPVLLLGHPLEDGRTLQGPQLELDVRGLAVRCV